VLKFSIAVPSLDYGRFLTECLASIAMQQDVELEVLIADGGSTDESLEIAENFVRNDTRFRITSRSDHGQADAIQKAFEESTGDIFGYLNADDLYLRPDALKMVAEAFADASAPDIVSFGGTYVDQHGRHLRPVRLRYHPSDSLDRIRFRPSVLQPGTFWRNRVQREIPFRTDLHFVFDAWFFFEAQRRFDWIERPDAIVGYRLHGSNKSVGVKPARVRELAVFEGHKFGEGSVRARYARAISRIAYRLRGTDPVRRLARRMLYLGVNSVSFASAYRLPSI
jgi:glycosyltransferase involved in cell wall biosynthesis